MKAELGAVRGFRLALEQAVVAQADVAVNLDQRLLAQGRVAVLGIALVKAREALTLKRSLVGGAQRLELTGWSAARLDWYKAAGCFTEIIRYQTRLFVPTEGAAAVLARLSI
jgi:hypothetical protein